MTMTGTSTYILIAFFPIMYEQMASKLIYFEQMCRFGRRIRVFLACCKLKWLIGNDLQLDDALSATRLPDGRIKVWIHVADPARFVRPGSVVDRQFW